MDGHYIFAVRFNVNVKAVFSTDGISNLVNEGKHVFALAPHGNIISIVPEMIISTVIFISHSHIIYF